MVSEVIFPRFWGVVCIEKCFRNFEIVVGSAVSEISNLRENHFRSLKSGFSAIFRIKRIFTQIPPMDDLRRSGFCLCSYSSN